MTGTVPQPPRRDRREDVEAAREHEGDTEDVGAEREGSSVEGGDEPPPW